MAWEYKVTSPAGLHEDLTEILNKEGRDGWELVSVKWPSDGHVARFAFKRPISAHEVEQ